MSEEEAEVTGREEAGAEGDVEDEEKENEVLLETNQARDFCLESITLFLINAHRLPSSA